jgi:hypothetical protein
MSKKKTVAKKANVKKVEQSVAPGAAKQAELLKATAKKPVVGKKKAGKSKKVAKPVVKKGAAKAKKPVTKKKVVKGKAKK